MIEIVFEVSMNPCLDEATCAMVKLDLHCLFSHKFRDCHPPMKAGFHVPINWGSRMNGMTRGTMCPVFLTKQPSVLNNITISLMVKPHKRL